VVGRGWLLLGLACAACDAVSGLSDFRVERSDDDGGAGGQGGPGGSGGAGGLGACGDGMRGGNEECDDANDVDTDGCTTECLVACPAPEWHRGANEHCYLWPPMLVSWDDASATCVALGAHLATVTSDPERAIVAEVVGAEGAWIGGRDGGGDVWAWVTAEPWEWPLHQSPPWTSTGEPNDMDGEDCLQAWDDGLFNDLMCSWQNPPLCELELPQ
jgi:cysteine-rich repeat protein